MRESSQVGVMWISIHAPAKGATCLFVRFPTIVAISIHAPAKGATIYVFAYIA